LPYPTGHRPRHLLTVGVVACSTVPSVLGVSACPAAVRPHPPVHHPRGEAIAPLTLTQVCRPRIPADWPSNCRPRVTRTPPPEPPGRQLSGVCRDDRVAADYPHRLRPQHGGAHRKAGHKSASDPRGDTVGTDQPGRHPQPRGHVYAVRPAPPARQADRATTVPSWSLCARPRPQLRGFGCGEQQLVAERQPPLGVLGRIQGRACRGHSGARPLGPADDLTSLPVHRATCLGDLDHGPDRPRRAGSIAGPVNAP
jgi:hypothetical protein